MGTVSVENPENPEDLERWEKYRTTALHLYGMGDDIDIDESAPVSEGSDDGAFVQAWVWVPDAEAGINTEE